MTTNATPIFSQNDERLALQALKDSEKLLNEIEIAKNHIEQVFRVQIEANSPDGFPTPDSELSLNLILSRLRTLKTTIQVNQFFPRSYFSQRFNIERTFDKENSETFETLSRFIKKYSFYGEEASWAIHAALEVDTFQSYDGVDFAKYLEVWRTNQEKEDPDIEDEQKEESETNTTNRDIETGKGSSETVATATSTATDQISTNSGSQGTKETSTTTVSDKSVHGPVIEATCPPVNPPSDIPQSSSSSTGKQIPISKNPIVTVVEDHTSVNSSKSSSSKKVSKFKNVFSFGKKKKGSCMIGLSSNSNGNGNGKATGKGKMSKAENERIVQRTENLLHNMGKRQ